MTDHDPSSFGQDPQDPQDPGPDPLGDPEPAGSQATSPLERLFDGSAPGPSIGELRSDYEMPQWAAVIARGTMRTATGSGVPPIAEIAIGGIMGLLKAQDDDTDDASDLLDR